MFIIMTLVTGIASWECKQEMKLISVGSVTQGDTCTHTIGFSDLEHRIYSIFFGYITPIQKKKTVSLFSSHPLLLAALFFVNQTKSTLHSLLFDMAVF